ncbi:hypothetical protein LCGC14_1675970 [marine sediment metagenome]|uniref:Uncharacterized protein n=1 Tax=marine sediment metagenome TaxID=412755 RepID=A0A0F9HQ13_9ZZZZ
MSETITGCVDFLTGEVKFTYDTQCTLKGCMVWEGVHAGQVAITITGGVCADTYYGCVDVTSGTFEVIIPDNCCDECLNCEWPGEFPFFIEETALIPDTYKVKFSGASNCGDNNCYAQLQIFCTNPTPDEALIVTANNSADLLNGTHILERDGCNWTKTIPGTPAVFSFFCRAFGAPVECVNFNTDFPFAPLVITMKASPPTATGVSGKVSISVASATVLTIFSTGSLDWSGEICAFVGGTHPNMEASSDPCSFGTLGFKGLLNGTGSVEILEP